MTKKILLLLVVFITSSVLVLGCGKEKKPTEVTAEQLTDQGWTKFAAGDYSGAGADFEAAVGLDTSYSRAYHGLGWAELYQDNAGLAEEAFRTYLSKASDLAVDAWAGLALACHAQDEFQGVIDYATQLLSSDPTWSFSTDPSTNYLDVALVLAHSYYMTAQFQSCLDVVNQYFDSGFSVDLDTDQGRTDLATKLNALYTG
jgi:tetratricopeptide (TPR) repeat protein